LEPPLLRGLEKLLLPVPLPGEQLIVVFSRLLAELLPLPRRDRLILPPEEAVTPAVFVTSAGGGFAGLAGFVDPGFLGPPGPRWGRFTAGGRRRRRGWGWGKAILIVSRARFRRGWGNRM